jgi:hypothetical protein
MMSWPAPVLQRLCATADGVGAGWAKVMDVGERSVATSQR